MSMLAGRKQKQRWSLNPRGKLWSEDVNKFGHKMLEKMGWSAGKGLGADEDGISEHVKRNKDLANRSEKDISNIFGRKTLERPAEPKETKEFAENGSEDKSFGVVTVKAGNMTEYFKSKLSKLGNISTSKGDYALNGRDDYESDIGACTGFEFTSEKDTPSLGMNKINFVSSQSAKTVETTTEEKPNNKKRKRSDLEDLTEVVSKKKKKSKKKQMAFDNLGNDINPAEEVCYDNPCLKQTDSPRQIENNDENARIKKHVTFSSPIIEVLNKSDDSNKAGKSKQKKKNKKITNGIDNLGCEDNSFEGSNQLSNEEKKNPKKKKKLSIYNNDSSLNVVLTKKKRKTKEVGIDNLACEEISANEEIEEIKRYILKKIAMEHGLVNPACEANDYSIQEPSPKKKKMKSKQIRLENLNSGDTKVQMNKNKKQKQRNENSFETFNDNISDVSQNDDGANTKKIKKKKKIAEKNNLTSPSKKLKKKSKSKDSGIENLGCEINTLEENIASINSEMDNYQTELENEINVKKVEKQKKKASKTGQKQNSPNPIRNNQQNTNENNFQNNSNFNEKPFGNRNSRHEIINNKFENRNNDFGNWHNGFDNRNCHFNYHQNSFNDQRGPNNFNRSFDDQSGFNNFNRSFDGQRGLNNFNRSFDGQRGFNNFNRSFDGQGCFNNFNRSFDGQGGFNNFNRSFDGQRGPNNFNRRFNNKNSTWKPRFNPDRVDKSSLKAILKPGELDLNFPGSNLMNLVGYGVTPEIIVKNYRPAPEPEPEPELEPEPNAGTT